MSTLNTYHPTNKTVSDVSAQKEINLRDIQDKTLEEIKSVYKSGGFVLLEALPASGKSYGTFKAAKETDTQITYLTSRRKLKGKAEERCKKFGLSFYTIPSPFEDCDSFSGDYGEAVANEVKNIYSNDVGATRIHKEKDLPCEGHCDYIDKLDGFDESVDVIIGNPKQAYPEKYRENRVVVKDEFSEGEYERTYENPREILNAFLDEVNLSFDNYSQLLEEKSEIDDNVIIPWYNKIESLYRDTRNAIRPGNYSSYAPALVLALIYAEEINSRWERFAFADIPDRITLDIGPINRNAVFLRDRREENLYLLNPPKFEKAEGFIGLDGTPVPEFWETATGLDLDHRRILDDSEKGDYINQVMGLEIIQLNDSPKPYGRVRNVTVPQDTRFAFAISQIEEEKPGLITSDKALKAYDELREYVDDEAVEEGIGMKFANVLSRNDFEKKEVGFVSGMPNYGDDYLEKWASYRDEQLTVNGERGSDREYTWIADDSSHSFRIHPYYRNLLLQSVMRFGREENCSATVYVNSSGLPDWVPTEEREIPRFGNAERGVYQYLVDSDAPRTMNEIADELGVSKRTIQRRIRRLEEEGIVFRYSPDKHNKPDRFGIPS